MPGFTEGGGKPAKVKKQDGVLPSKKSAPVKKPAGSVPPRATADSDGVGFDDVGTDMTDSKSGPAKGASFIGGKKYGAAAISQAIRRKHG